MKLSIFSYLLCTLYSFIAVLAKLNFLPKTPARELRRELFALASASIYQSVKSDLWVESGSKRYVASLRGELVQSVL